MDTNDLFQEFEEKAKLRSPNKRQFHRKAQRYAPGATIGDGMKSWAKLAAGMTTITLLLKSGPMILAALAGCIIFFRSCSWNSQLAMRPQPIVAQSTATPVVEPVASQAAISPPKPQRISPRLQSVTQSRITELQPAIMPTVIEEEFVPSGLFAGPLPPILNSPMGMGQEFAIPAMQPPSRGFLGMGGMGFGLPNPVTNAISESPSNDLGTFGTNPLFNNRKGRKFEGTSQMPGEPSRRISLSIGEIREHGRNVTARLSTIQGTRASRNFSGLVEFDPPRLTLIPDANPNGFGTFLTHMPWYSNSPTRITLQILSDGKALSGTSGSGEEFELLPVQEAAPRPQITESTFAGFGDSSPEPTKWRLAKRNGESIADQHWEFFQEQNGKGRFTWFKGTTRIASGTYSEELESGQVDIVSNRDQQSEAYRGLFKLISGSKDRIQVCIPKTAQGDRPATVSEQLGNVFELCAMGGNGDSK